MREIRTRHVHDIQSLMNIETDAKMIENIQKDLDRTTANRASSLDFKNPLTPAQAKAQSYRPVTQIIRSSREVWILWTVAADMARSGIRFRLVREYPPSRGIAESGLALWRGK